MRVCLITLRFDDLTGKIDDVPLNEFLRDKDVISVRDHFFVKDSTPYLALLVTYNSGMTLSDIPIEKPSKRQDDDWRKLIKEADKPLFEALREWRAERCKQEGVPPYIICTNRQLALMLQKRPQSLSKLGDIDGFGKAKLEKYGADILNILAPKSVS